MNIAIICNCAAKADASSLCGNLPTFGYFLCLGVWDDSDERAPAIAGIEAAECAVLVGNPLPTVEGENLADIFIRLGKAVVHVPYQMGENVMPLGEPAAWIFGLATWPSAVARRGTHRVVTCGLDATLIHRAIEAAVADPPPTIIH